MRETVSTDGAPAAIGAYSQAVRGNGFVFTAGQIPMDADGELVTGPVAAQTRQCLDNIQVILREAGCGMADVVKVTVYLDDLEDFDAMNAAYEGYFDDEPPARSAVEVGAIPKGAALEIEAVAVVPEE